MLILYFILLLIVYFIISHYISYFYIKNKILKSKNWDLNICCGKTGIGKVNADIHKHKNVPNFVLIKDIYNLPFKDNEFENVICSHTIEHVRNPRKFFKELQRVGKNVTLIIPPLYDITAALNIFEHKWIFLSFKKEHKKLPPHIKLPFANFLHKRFRQINHA